MEGAFAAADRLLGYRTGAAAADSVFAVFSGTVRSHGTIQRAALHTIWNFARSKLEMLIWYLYSGFDTYLLKYQSKLSNNGVGQLSDQRCAQE